MCGKRYGHLKLKILQFWTAQGVFPSFLNHMKAACCPSSLTKPRSLQLSGESGHEQTLCHDQIENVSRSHQHNEIYWSSGPGSTQRVFVDFFVNRSTHQTVNWHPSSSMNACFCSVTEGFATGKDNPFRGPFPKTSNTTVHKNSDRVKMPTAEVQRRFMTVP